MMRTIPGAGKSKCRIHPVLYTQLRSFHSVAKEGSVTRASRALRVSRPALTTQVRGGGLGEYWEVEWFFRHGCGVKIAELGEHLYKITQPVFRLASGAGDLVSSAASTPNPDISPA